MNDESRSHRERWAELRFSIIGGLLSSPPHKGELRTALEALAKKRYRHPTLPDKWSVFGVSTIERWYYLARDTENPIEALTTKVRSDAGQTRVMKPELLGELEQQYKAHRKWTYLLHFENLEALVGERPELGPSPSYPTVRRRMQARGWLKQRSAPRHPTAGQLKAAERLEKREVRSYETSHVGALWHLDFHEGKLRVADSHGQWHTPVCFAVLDDYSRLCCHLQWYFVEDAENLIHGLCQAFHKRGLPRALMTDNGSAMTAGETRNGLRWSSIDHATTLAYSAYQNGKQESFWGSVEGRLCAMLENVEPLTLAFLNRASAAWAELSYNQKRHDELGISPLKRMLEGTDVSRPGPASDILNYRFTRQETRIQRRSDGTISLKGVRFEIPSRLRLMHKVVVRYRQWDLSRAYVADERMRTPLATIYPLDKTKNADGRRRSLESFSGSTEIVVAENTDPVPPLMRKLLADYAATGLPPAFLPKDEIEESYDD